MLQEIIDVLAQYTDVPSEQINETSSLIDDLELNSFDVMTIVADFEEQYDIHIDKKKIQIPQPIKMLGKTSVNVKLHTDVNAQLTVEVTD